MKLIEFKANSVLAVQDDVIEIDPARRVTVAQEERAHRPYNWQLSTTLLVYTASKDPVSPIKL